MRQNSEEQRNLTEVDRLYVYDNSLEDVKAQPLFRLRDGILGKMYVKSVPEWAKNIIPKK